MPGHEYLSDNEIASISLWLSQPSRNLAKNHKNALQSGEEHEKLRTSPLSCIPLAIVPAAFAQHETLLSIRIQARLLSLWAAAAPCAGTFHLQSGSIAFDPSAQKISGSVIVSAGSGNSGEPSRDKKMNTDVLDTGTLPK